MSFRNIRANKTERVNAGGLRQFPIWTPLTARVGQFGRSTERRRRGLFVEPQCAKFLSSVRSGIGLRMSPLRGWQT